jgi:2-haloacid dehalogenase
MSGSSKQERSHRPLIGVRLGHMSTVFFDLNGTLLDPSVLAGPLGGDEQAETLVAAALGLAIEQGMARTIVDRYEPFSDLLERALRQQLAAAGRPDDGVEDALDLTGRMPPFLGAEEALDELASAGHTLAVLTNSARSDAEAALNNAGLRDRFAEVVGTDEIGAYKPARRVYEAGLERLGVDAGSSWLVAAHWFDVLGARAAGLRACWAGHQELAPLEGIDPDARGANLPEAARALIESDRHA